MTTLTAVLLACTVSSGADQSFEVDKTSQGLLLKEFTQGGELTSRPVGAAEWASGKLQLGKNAKPDGGTNVITRDPQGRWVLTITDGSLSSVEIADCRKR